MVKDKSNKLKKENNTMQTVVLTTQFGVYFKITYEDGTTEIVTIDGLYKILNDADTTKKDSIKKFEKKSGVTVKVEGSDTLYLSITDAIKNVAEQYTKTQNSVKVTITFETLV